MKLYFPWKLLGTISGWLETQSDEIFLETDQLLECIHSDKKFIFSEFKCYAAYFD